MAGAYRIGLPSQGAADNIHGQTEPVGLPQPPSIPTEAAPEMAPEPVLPAPALPGPATAGEGVHPLTVSSEEGLYAVMQQEVIAALQKLLKLKYAAVLMYMNYGDRVRAHYRDVIYAHFQEHMKEEQSHCYDLAMKITALGGEPAPKAAPVLDVRGIDQTFMAVLQQEKGLLQAERDILTKTGDNIGLKVLIENMVLADQRHADDARRMFLCEQ